MLPDLPDPHNPEHLRKMLDTFEALTRLRSVYGTLLPTSTGHVEHPDATSTTSYTMDGNTTPDMFLTIASLNAAVALDSVLLAHDPNPPHGLSSWDNIPYSTDGHRLIVNARDYADIRRSPLFERPAEHVCFRPMIPIMGSFAGHDLYVSRLAPPGTAYRFLPSDAHVTHHFHLSFDPITNVMEASFTASLTWNPNHQHARFFVHRQGPRVPTTA